MIPPSSPVYTAFTPGRGLSPECQAEMPLDLYDGQRNPKLISQTQKCLDSVGNVTNNPSAYLTSSYHTTNHSNANTYLSKPEGWLIVPANIPAGLNFRASTFRSWTECEVVSNFCDITVPVEVTDQYLWVGDFTYDCNLDRTGLIFHGNVSNLRNSSSSFQAGHTFALEYYTDSTKTTLLSENKTIAGPSISYAALLQVQWGFVANQTLMNSKEYSNYSDEFSGNTSYTALGGLIALTGYESASSILSCRTTLSDVVSPISDGNFPRVTALLRALTHNLELHMGQWISRHRYLVGYEWKCFVPVHLGYP